MTDLSRSVRRCLASATLLATATLGSTSALAATPELEEIIVTAQKREQKLSDTPVSVTALSGKDLESMAATQLRDFATNVPGLNFTTSGVGQNQVNLRGITTGGNVSPTVGIYVDDVPYGSSTPFAGAAGLALDVGLFDMQRIEVLRGPQGTLYGASTMGGLLKYVPNRPDTQEFGGTARAGIAMTEEGGTSYDVASAINVPLASDKAALRVSGFYSRDGGFIDNVELGKDDVDEADVYGGRADLLLQPTDELSVRLAFHAQNISRDGAAQADYDFETSKPIDGSLNQHSALLEPFSQQFRLGSATIDYDFDFATLTSVTSYQSATGTTFQDGTALFVPVINDYFIDVLHLLPPEEKLSKIGVDSTYETDKFTQELRLAATGEHLDWLVGAFYTDEDSKQLQTVPAWLLSGERSSINWGDVKLPSNYEEIAGFGTVTYHATSQLDLEGGLRYSHNSQWQEQNTSGLLVPTPIPKRDSSEDNWTWLAAAKYRVSENVMTYLRVATSYRPGGPNLVLADPVTGLPLAPPTFDSDTLISYEAGVKASTSDRRFSVDAAIYQINWDDLQVVANRNGVGVVANASEAQSRGAELTVTALPIPALTLVGAFAYIDAELSKDAPDLGGAEGDPLPNTPEFTAAISADYAFPVAERDASVGATWKYIDDRVTGFDSFPAPYPNYDLPSYDTFDLRAGIEFGSARCQLYVRNLLDERGQLSAAVLAGAANVAILQPRTYGLSINVDF